MIGCISFNVSLFFRFHQSSQEILVSGSPQASIVSVNSDWLNRKRPVGEITIETEMNEG